MQDFFVERIWFLSHSPPIFAPRINMRVEDVVKKRLFEERALRDKKFQEEREKDRQERQAEICRIKKAHDREIQTLRNKYERDASL